MGCIDCIHLESRRWRPSASLANHMSRRRCLGLRNTTLGMSCLCKWAPNHATTRHRIMNLKSAVSSHTTVHESPQPLTLNPKPSKARNLCSYSSTNTQEYVRGNPALRRAEIRATRSRRALHPRTRRRRRDAEMQMVRLGSRAAASAIRVTVRRSGSFTRSCTSV